MARKNLRIGITADELRSVLSYDPDTGVFTWLSRSDVPNKWNSKWSGKRAGSVFGNGYRYIGINRVSYKASRLAWLYMTGEWPDGDVDHENRVKTDDRFCNLRDATPSQNGANRVAQSNNSHGFKGIYYDKQRRRWRAVIRVNGVKIFLGRFKTPEEAHEKYAEAAKTYYGKFARAS